MTLPPLPPPIFSTRAGGVFAFMPDSERLVLSGTGPKSLSRIISLSTGQDVLTFEKPPSSVRINAISQDGNTVALAAHDNKVVIYDPQTGMKKQTLKIEGYVDPSGLAFAPGSCDLLHSSWDGLTALEADAEGIYSVRSVRVTSAFPDNTMYYAIAFAASSNRFAYIWYDYTGTHISLCLWPPGDEINRIAIQNYPHSYCLDRILFSPDDCSVLLTVPDGSIASWTPGEASHLAYARTPIAFSSPIPGLRGSDLNSGSLNFSPDGTILAYGLNGALGLWAWPSGERLGEWRLPGREPSIYQIGFSPTGRELVVSCYGPGISVYRVVDLLNTD